MLVNLTLLLGSEPSARIVSDTNGFLVAAKGIHGQAVDGPAEPSESGTNYRQPLYPLLLAGGLFIDSENAVIPTVIAQILLLLATGIIARRIAEVLAPGYGLLVMGLVLFNPHALGSAQILISDTLFAALFVAAVWTGIHSLTGPIGWAVATGLLLGLAILTRPDPIYLTLSLPVLLPMLALLGRRPSGLTVALRNGIVGLAVAVAVVSPWAWSNAQKGFGWTASSGQQAHAFLRNNVAFLEYQSQVRLSWREAKAEMAEQQQAFVDRQGERWLSFSAMERGDALVAYWLERMGGYPPGVYLNAAAQSAVNMFAAGGSAFLVELLDLEMQSSIDIMRSGEAHGRIGSWLASIQSGSLWAVLVNALGLGFALFLRLLGLIGFIYLLAKRDWQQIVLISGLIVYVTLIHLFLGNSRYRLPLEPLLFILAAHGIAGLRYVVWSRLRVARSTTA